MINKIENWIYDKPTEGGDYLTLIDYLKPTVGNVNFISVIETKEGELVSVHGWRPISSFSSSYKFAKLVYSPSELDSDAMDGDAMEKL